MRHRARDVCDALADPHLTGSRLRAETGGEVERAAAVATVNRHRLAGIEADADVQRQYRIEGDLVRERQLELDRRTERVARRGEDRERLVAAKLDDLAAVRLDAFAGESRRTSWRAERPPRRLGPA